MDRRAFIGTTLAALGSGAGCASDGPAVRGRGSAAALTRSEHERIIRGLGPPKRTRPLVAVVLESGGSEVTDALVPFGVLSESGLAEVVVLSERTDPVHLFPALTVRPQQAWGAFDRMHPDGADYVIVPACHRADASALVEWIQRQAAKEARIVGVCAGAVTLAAAGLLDGKRGTTHWYERRRLLRTAKDMDWIANRRYVVDGTVVTTTGVTASIPLSMALVEAIAGRRAAETLATKLGVDDWSAAHDSSRYGLHASALLTALSGRLSPWNRARIGVPAPPGVHEISLALAVDAWARTDRARPVPVGEAHSVTTRNGLELRTLSPPPDRLRMVPAPEAHQPARQLDRTLATIRRVHGRSVAEWVALQLEYPAERVEQTAD